MPSAAYDYGGNGYGYGQSNGFSGPREPPMNPYTMAALAAAAGPGRPVPLPLQAPLPIRITGQGPMVARPPPPSNNDRRFGIKIKIAAIAVATFVLLSSAMFYRFIDTVTCSIWVGTGPCISAETGSPTMKGTTIAATLMFLIVLWTLRKL